MFQAVNFNRSSSIISRGLLLLLCVAGIVLLTSYTAVSSAHYSSETDILPSLSTIPQNVAEDYFIFLPMIVTPAGPEEKIVFASDMGNTPGVYDIFIMSADGTNITNLTNSPSTSETKPIWSPDGTKIAYISDPAATEEIFIMNADGSNKVNVSNAPSAQDRSPSWSHDSSKIAFMSDRNAAEDIFDIFVVNANGTGLLNLTNSVDKDERGPDWSPVNSKIVFTTDLNADVSYHTLITSVNADGTNAQTLYDGGIFYLCYGPKWSPDGSQIAFTLWGTDYQIAMINADGTNMAFYPSNMTLNGLQNIRWNASGSEIAFSGIESPGDTFDLLKLNLQNGNATNLTNPTNISFEYGLEWSVNNDKLIFTQSSADPSDLFVINADGTGLTNLTNLDSSNERYPDWALVPAK